MMQRVKHMTTGRYGTVEEEMFFFGLTLVRWDDDQGNLAAEDPTELMDENATP